MSESEKLKAFNDADRDRSGQLSWEEFCRIGKKLKALGSKKSASALSVVDGG